MGFLESSGIADLTGGLWGESEAESAAKQGRRLSKKAAKLSEAEFGESWADIEGMINPYIDAGAESLGAYKEAIGVTPDTPVFEDFDFDPSKMEENDAYKFIMGEEMQATDRLAAKNRALTSGNRLTATQDRAAGVASKEYGNEWERQFKGNEYNNQLLAAKYGLDYGQTRDAQADRLNLVGAGQTASTNLSNLRMTQANAMSNIYNRRAADVTASYMVPAQEKMNYVSGVQDVVGQMMGGMGCSRDIKENKEPIVHSDILAGVNKLDVESWNYIGEDDKHIGPYAEDFKELFGVGDGKTISYIDVIGVLLSAVKAQQKQIAALGETA